MIHEEKEIDVLKVVAKSKKDQIQELRQLFLTKAETEKITEHQQIAGTRKLTEVENQLNAGTRKQAELEILALEKKLVDEIKDVKQMLSTKAGIGKLTEIGNQQLKLQDKGVTYIRWGKTLCDGSNTETLYSGQAGGSKYSQPGSSVNYLCLPLNPDVAQPLKNIVGWKTCNNGWTKEYDGILMAGHPSHAAASEYACLDKGTETIAGGSRDENGILFYPVKTVCGSLKCPPYAADTDVPCVVCSK
ncbi:unnamed protein product [Mytilus edulis]|uniref:Uncharacterized protein n=1 Tax=Mytilus edulis TaxID=6550 RepID=A0A8S3PXK1_MYTED|nr:unnamed protein product [Mytilus edulis]